MPLFDSYVMVDWSAAAVPRRGRDSIWIAVLRRARSGLHRDPLANPSTRAAATRLLGDRLAALAESGRRVLVGFDFPFGYPAGTARRLGLDGPAWREMWRALAELVEDADDNANNRFEVGAALNRRLSGGAFPFWGHPPRRSHDFLLPTAPRPHQPSDLAPRRLCELRAPRAQPVWKLAYAGSVGSQVLTGIPRVLELRCDPRLAGRAAIWPFETGLRHDPAPAVVFAEVYPSLFRPQAIPGKPKDAGQVAAVVEALAALDGRGALAPLFAGDPSLEADERRAVEAEEAWILGAPAALWLVDQTESVRDIA